MKLIFRDGVFQCRCSFQNRHVPKEAGFSWHPSLKFWYTNRIQVAARLRDYADESAKKKISALVISVKPWHGPLPFPEDFALRPFQHKATRFALSRNRSYLWLDPGLGKGVIAVVISNAIAAKSEKPPSVVYICPPFLTRNVEEEFKTWRTFEGMIHRYEHSLHPDARVLIFPDSKLQNDEHRFELEAFIEVARRDGRKVIGFVDEAHRYKTPDAKRTEYLLGREKAKKKDAIPSLVRHFAKVVYLSGTAMPNRPMELFTILNKSAPETIDFMNMFEYGRKYCGGYTNDFGKWDFSGHSNLEELKENMEKAFMLRMRKDEVLTELPAKIEEFLFIGDDAGKRVTEMGRSLLAHHSPEDLLKSQIAVTLGKNEEELHLATYRRLLGREKVNPATEVIREMLEGSGESLIVFAYHTDVIAALAANLSKYDPLVITGDTPMNKRQDLVNIFQRSKDHRLFIMQINTAIGYTMTKATRVLHVEPSYVPADNDQASDRAHRIGQKDSVFVQYLVYKNSLDRMILDIVLRKKNVIAKI